MIMWSTKKKTIEVFFVLTDGQTEIENTSENMQLALQVSGPKCYHISPVLGINVIYHLFQIPT